MRQRQRSCHDGSTPPQPQGAAPLASGGSPRHTSRIKHDPRRKSLVKRRLSAEDAKQVERSSSFDDTRAANRRSWRPIDALRRSFQGTREENAQDGDCKYYDIDRHDRRRSLMNRHPTDEDVDGIPPTSGDDHVSSHSRRQKAWRPIDSLRRSFKGIQHEKEHQRHTDSTSVTLSSNSSASNDSSCFNAGESKEDHSGNCSIPPVKHVVWKHRSSSDELHTFETDQAVVCDINGLTLKVARRRQKRQQLDQKQKHVQQIVEQLLHEQTLALEAWDEVATEYHQRIEPFTSMFVPQLLDPKYLIPSSDAPSKDDFYYLEGKSILDVAAGTGAGAIYAKSRGASSVMATDFSEEMIRVLQRRIEAYPSQNIGIDTLVANGLCLPFYWTNMYDIVFSNFGVIYFPKIVEGLREMVRCAKQGGKVCISGWGSKEETHAFSVFPSAMKRCGLDKKWYRAQSSARKQLLALSGTVPLAASCEHHPKEKHRSRYHGVSLTPNYFCPTTRVASSQYYLRSIMVQAGLEDVQVVSVTNELRLDSAESYWNRFVLASPNLKRFVEHCLNPGELALLKEAVSDIVLEESQSDGDGDGVALKASAYIAIGTKIGA